MVMACGKRGPRFIRAASYTGRKPGYNDRMPRRAGRARAQGLPPGAMVRAELPFVRLNNLVWGLGSMSVLTLSLLAAGWLVPLIILFGELIRVAAGARLDAGIAAAGHGGAPEAGLTGQIGRGVSPSPPPPAAAGPPG
jgi:hypothetical protein